MRHSTLHLVCLVLERVRSGFGVTLPGFVTEVLLPVSIELTRPLQKEQNDKSFRDREWSLISFFVSFILSSLCGVVSKIGARWSPKELSVGSNDGVDLLVLQKETASPPTIVFFQLYTNAGSCSVDMKYDVWQTGSLT